MKTQSPVSPVRAPTYPAPLALLALAALFLRAGALHADERMFTYNYEASAILPKGGFEFEQWITYRGGKGDGIFAGWDLREEIEFGVTDQYTTAGYLNFSSTHSDGVAGMADESDFAFKGVSWENKYQLVNPLLKPVGVLLYAEVTTDGSELELEEKLVLQSYLGEDKRWNLVFNATLEQEWEWEADETESELVLEFTAGISYKLSPHWAVGFEARNEREFAGISFSDQEANGWFVGPNVHYGTARWWATLTVLPQIAGSPATDGGLNLDAFTRIEVRFIAGVNF